MKHIPFLFLLLALTVSASAQSPQRAPGTGYDYVKSSDAGQLPATTTNDSATSGQLGEYITATVATGASVSLTTATAANVVSLSLTAGDWDVTGVAGYTIGSGTVTTLLQQGISTNGTPTLGSQGTYTAWPMQLGTAGDAQIMTPVVRVSLSATTTVYLVIKSSFTTNTLNAYGFLRARRVR